MVVLDLLCRESSVTSITLIEPDTYAAHNVHRHIFPPAAVGQQKATLAAEWARERRTDLSFEAIVADITDESRRAEYERLARACDIGVCAVDNERAKYAFDRLMRGARKPWTLGEVLSGGIGGWVHRFAPGGPCYGCVASFLQRTVAEAPPEPLPDYSSAGTAIPETTIPASKASIEVIAGLHALATLEELADRSSADAFTSLLFSLQRVPEVFDQAFRSFRYRIAQSPDCLVCSERATADAGGNLDVAVDQALGRLAAL